MNDLTDLRRTLDDRAATAAGAGIGERQRSVHHRIGVARRRRRAGAAGLTAAVVATVAGVALLPDDGASGPGPAGPSVYGIDLPAQLDSLGYRYDYAEHVSGQDGRARLRLPAADEPRLVTWGTSGDDDVVRLSASRDSGDTVRSASDFTDWIVVDAGQPLDVTARTSDGQPALAVYELTDERPAGVTGAGLTFRQEIADGTLLAARIGEAGEADLTVDATATGPGTLVVALCTGTSDEDLTVHTETVGAGGDTTSGASCGEPFPLDGLASSSSAFASRPGEDVTTRFWLTRGLDGPVVDDTAVRLAVAVYSLDHDPLAGVPTLLESEGHTWRLAPGSQVDGDGSRTVSIEVPAGDDTALVWADVTTRGRSSSIRSEFGEETTVHEFPKGGGTTITELVNPGEPATVTVTEGDPADLDITMQRYVRAD